VGFYKSREEISSLLAGGATFTPEMTPDRRFELLDGWHRAVKACRGL
jgi:glycerol kinase